MATRGADPGQRANVEWIDVARPASLDELVAAVLAVAERALVLRRESEIVKIDLDERTGLLVQPQSRRPPSRVGRSRRAGRGPPLVHSGGCARV